MAVERCTEQHDDPLSAIVDHLKAAGAQMVIATQSGPMLDSDVQALLDAGYVWDEKVEYVSGKRIRMLRLPREVSTDEEALGG